MSREERLSRLDKLLKNVNYVKIREGELSVQRFMTPPQPSEQELLKTVLQPLLEDFQYWFSRSRTLLETEDLSFLGSEGQSALLARVKQVQQEVSTANMLFKATEGKAGIDTATLMPWHQLLMECWQVSMKWRSLNSASEENS